MERRNVIPEYAENIPATKPLKSASVSNLLLEHSTKPVPRSLAGTTVISIPVPLTKQLLFSVVHTVESSLRKGKVGDGDFLVK
jgi:hypothetical protein